MNWRSVFAQASCLVGAIVAKDQVSVAVFAAACFIIAGCAPHAPSTPSTEGQGA